MIGSKNIWDPPNFGRTGTNLPVNPDANPNDPYDLKKMPQFRLFQLIVQQIKFPEGKKMNS